MGQAAEHSGFLISLLNNYAESDPQGAIMITTLLRWVFVVLALYILVSSILSLLKTRNPSEIWAYLHLEDGTNVPLSHWENVIGRARSCDVPVEHLSVSRNHGTLIRKDEDTWVYTDLKSKNGSYVNSKAVLRTPINVHPGDVITVGSVNMTLFPVSLEEQANNDSYRREKSGRYSTWGPIVALTLFQLLTGVQLILGLGQECTTAIPLCIAGLVVLMWVYFLLLRSMGRRGFEMETIAFFLCTLSLATTASAQDGIFTQFAAIVMGVALFFALCWYLRDLDRAKSIRRYMLIGSVVLLLVNLVFGSIDYGAANWVHIGSFSFQPSELVKIAYIYVGAATLDELFRKKNLLTFAGLSVLCLGALAIMGDFGTAAIFFVTFLVISFLRSGDFSKLVLIVLAAVAGLVLLLRYMPYIADRFSVWGHVWEFADEGGYQQTRTMCASASGGFIGVGAGNGWLGDIFAASKDLVFGMLIEEWGLIIAILAIISVVTLCVFATRNILAGRSTFYTIAACSSMSMLLLQLMLNVFGSVDLLPLTGVTFPFVSNGGSSMLATWGLMSFLKASDTREGASIAVKAGKRFRKVKYEGPVKEYDLNPIGGRTVHGPVTGDKEPDVIEITSLEDLLK